MMFLLLFGLLFGTITNFNEIQKLNSLEHQQAYLRTCGQDWICYKAALYDMSEYEMCNVYGLKNCDKYKLQGE